MSDANVGEIIRPSRKAGQQEFEPIGRVWAFQAAGTVDSAVTPPGIDFAIRVRFQSFVTRFLRRIRVLTDRARFGAVGNKEQFVKKAFIVSVRVDRFFLCVNHRREAVGLVGRCGFRKV